jgi:glycosyltransferase involved in cell wall biosynthesis
MKILFVGMPFSMHAVRWINQIADLNWEIHFFSSFEYAQPHSELKNVTYHDHFYNIQNGENRNLKFRSFKNKRVISIKYPIIRKYIGKVYRHLGLQKKYDVNLAHLIYSIKPDIVHSLESQHAGYLVSKYYINNPKLKPYWLHTTYGIDLDFFSRLDFHRELLRGMFEKINLYLAEGNRDVNYAMDLGYTKKHLVFPSAGGGYDIQQFRKLNTMAPSERRVILVKGYQGALRRGLVALNAVYNCSDLLLEYQVFAFGCNKDVIEYIEYKNYNSKFKVRILPDMDYNNWIETLSTAKISITVNLSDGIPSTLFESMLLGVFPIQSNTSCANEWIADNENGFLVPPENPNIIEESIRVALSDDELVDRAAKINFKKMSENLDYLDIKEKTIQMYQDSLKIN